ncbi:DNA polymerase III subunit [Thermophilibacter immobilis]|jgi:DNA polymerase-3 subunit delta'|uniref:DNA polymerase III subunit delta n=1 Tax=Thermophilibacter immobilis TaxID=2779519 RepID=A0A7S7RUY9_9ACTN|nr:DNA polymerase III subunit delta' [Thermophilibacter immobilis]QOY61053.1 DNA polymerase III subunit delta' [Thermophilibacter immobilis]
MAAVPAALGVLSDQPRVRDFLATALADERLSHAYLFVGPPGSGKHEAARALAQCVVCPQGGDATCDDCRRVAHHTHSDVHWLRPGSATGYLVAQVRDLIADAHLAPVRARTKVYVLERAGLLRGTAANALLKTLEEPPRDVMFILCGRTTAALLPTVASRCQQVPFSVVSPQVGVASVMRSCTATTQEARVALAVAGAPARAVDFLGSPARRQVRRLVVGTLDSLARADSWDVLVAAREIVAGVAVPLADVKQAQEEAVKDSTDFLSASALKQVADANKRELTARERSGMMEALAAVDSLLRDVLIRCEDVRGPIVNEDSAAVVDRLASECDTRAVLRALEASARAADDLAHNVSPQLTVEVMLLRIKEALTCPPSFR